MKSLRRSIIVICLILLSTIILPTFSGLKNGKYYSTELKTLVKNGKADVIEVNKKIQEGGVFQIQHWHYMMRKVKNK